MWLKYFSVVSLLIIVIVRMLSKSRGGGFANLGLIAGLVLGLSASPVLATTLTAVFTLAGVLIPLYVKAPAGEREPASDPLPDVRHWLFPLTSWLALGLVYGIFLRANDALNFSENLRTHYAAQGYTPAQVDAIMAAQAAALAKQTPPAADGPKQTNLQSLRREASWDKLLSDLVRPTDPAAENLNRVKKAVAPEDLERIQWLESRGTPPGQVLEVLKTWHLEQSPEGAAP